MNTKEFAEEVYQGVIEQADLIYENILNESSSRAGTDPYWKSVFALYDSLDDVGRATVRAIMHQVSVDALSALFAVVDGTGGLSGKTYDLSLFMAPEGDRLDGNLQDYFLEIEENKGRL